MKCTLRLRSERPFTDPENFHPPNLGGESSKITCFTVFCGARSLNLGGEIFTPRIWGVKILRGMENLPDAKIPGKWEEDGKWAQARHGQKWPPKWKNGPQNGDFGLFIFHFGGHFLAMSGLGPFSIFFPTFPGFLRRAGFPFCKWPLRSHIVNSNTAIWELESFTVCTSRFTLCAETIWRKIKGQHG